MGESPFEHHFPYPAAVLSDRHRRAQILIDLSETGSSAGATASPLIADNASLDLFSKPAPSVPTQLPNGYPKKPVLSLELETDDSTSSDEQSVDPFNPDPSVSDIDNDPGHDDYPQRSSSTSSALNDRPRDFFGSSPHPAPSADGSPATSSLNLPFVPATTQSIRSGSEAGLGSGSGSSTPQEIVPPPGTRDGAQTQTFRSPPEPGTSTSPSSRSNKEKKPPPPPRSHHGKRITTATNTTAGTSGNATSSSSYTSPPRSTNRLSYHAPSPESQVSTRRSGTPNAGSTSQAPGSDYFTFSVSPEDQQRARARAPNSTNPGESVHRSASQHSQHKRPPTPPLSRRHSQMRRSKSTQSKTSGSRLTMSSLDSESTDSSQPPSPGLSTRSLASSIPDRKRLSMPPPSSRSMEREVETRAMPGHSLPPDSLSSPSSTSRSNPPPSGRRTSSHSSILSGGLSSAVAPPPPPPPRRARDSSSRSSEGRPVSQVIGVEEAPLPQPSNAQDILADLSRLQKEVDDLRGHYESRKVSQ